MAMELRGQRLEDLVGSVGRVLSQFVSELDTAPTMRTEDPTDVIGSMMAMPPEQPRNPTELVEAVREAAAIGLETSGPRFLAYVPGGGDVVSAVAEMLARGLNRYGSIGIGAPALTALEQSVVRWMTSLFEFPSGSGGVLTTGGSQAMLSMIVAAREKHVGEDLAAARIYLSDQAHHSVAKAAKIAGFPARSLRLISTSDGRRLDPAAVAAAVSADRAAGLNPFLLVATAGTTNTGDIDPLPELGVLAAEQRMWFHVDACYGGFFQLTERGRERMAGITQADSISLDPHKSLFLPFGTGALLVRDVATLAAAHTPDLSAEYLRDVGSASIPDYADLGMELTRENRGLRVWLPLHMHGLAAYRAALNEKLDLAQHVYQVLEGLPELVVPHRPELSSVVFGLRGGSDEDNTAFLGRINATRRVFLSSTRLRGRVVVRLCVLSYRSHAEHVNEALDIIAAAIR